MSVAPIVGSLPRSLWPHDVIVWVRSLCPGGCTTMPSPLGDYDETRGCQPQNDTGLFIETPFPVLCDEQTHYEDGGRRAD